MNAIAEIYRAVLLRAAFGSYRHLGKVADLHQFNGIAERLAECERAQEILRAKGYGHTGQTFVELASSVPERPRRILDQIFAPRAPQHDGLRYPPEEIARYFAAMPDDEQPDKSR